MAEEPHIVPVPDHLKCEAVIALEVLRRELREKDPAVPDSAIIYSGPTGKFMLGGFGEAAVVYVVGAAAKAVTERFIVEIVWPKVKPLVEDKAEQVLIFLRSLVIKT